MKMRKIGFLCSAAFLFIMMGCASSPVVNNFMDPDTPVRDHAILSVDNNVLIGIIDGIFQGGKASGSGGAGIISKTPSILLTPGRHTLGVMYYQRTSDGRTTTTSQTDIVFVNHDFQAGRFYRLLPENRGNTIAFNIVEEASPDIWDTIWIYNKRAMNTTYEYSFNTDGHLILMYKSGQRGFNFLAESP